MTDRPTAETTDGPTTSTEDTTMREATDLETNGTERPTTDRATMAEVSHTPPYDDALSGALMFSRGRVFATDGGESRRPGATPGGRRRTDRPASRDRATMADVDHAPPDGEGAVRVWDRGLPKPGVHVAGDR